jgi:curved DNA-binding protein CbpA
VLPEIPTTDIALSAYSDEEAAQLARLRGELASLRKKDHFEVLGLPRSADKDEVKRAYFALAKEYHPDKRFSYSGPELRRIAGEILALISTAHDTLVDDQERERYLEALADGVKREVTDEVSRILAAEGRFERGKELLRTAHYKEACAALGEAVSIYPEEGEFHAYLGWGLFQANPASENQAEQALAALERGIRLNPKLDKAYLFMGYIFKSMGLSEKAEKHFEKAVEVNPDNRDALRELKRSGR